MSQLMKIINNREVIIYDNDEDRTKGLLRFDNPPYGKAFLFKFENSSPLTFHTVGMKFNIDIHFFNENKDLIYSKFNCPPGEIVSSILPSKYVVEIPI